MVRLLPKEPALIPIVELILILRGGVRINQSFINFKIINTCKLISQYTEFNLQTLVGENHKNLSL